MTSLVKKIIVTILTWESRLIISKYKPFIVAVTGSVGKTSTKDALYVVLKNSARFARKSEKSLNSEIGLPLTIIGVPNAWHNLFGWLKNIIRGLELIMWRMDYPDCLVLEIGADHPGDIKKVTKWLKPNIAVITRVSQTPVHVEFFATPEDVFKEKSYLATAVKKDGTLILFADEEKVMTLAGPAKEAGVKVMSFGKNSDATVRGTDYAPVYAGDNGNQVLVGSSFNLNMEGQTTSLTIDRVLGETYMYPILASAAAGLARSMSPSSIIESFSRFSAPLGRMNVIPGLNGTTIIDDTYNSSPAATESALESLAVVKCSGRKIVAFGDMLELGKYASDEHKKMGKLVSQIAQVFVAVGPRTQTSAVPEAIASGMNKDSVYSFNSSKEAGTFLASFVNKGDVVLVKGSQSMRMERVSSALLADPSRAADLLVRQEKEWLEKA